LEQHDSHLGQNETCKKSLLGERINEISMNYEVRPMNGTVMPLSRTPAFDLLINPSGTTTLEDEANSLAGLLQRRLDYTPENPLPAYMFVKHRWFAGDF